MLDKDVPIEELKEGMILSEPIVAFSDGQGQITLKAGNSIPDRGLAIDKSTSDSVSGPTVLLPIGRLSAVTIADIKKLAAEGAFHSFGDHLKIQQPVRFAPVLLVGVLLTLLSGGLFYRWFS